MRDWWWKRELPPDELHIAWVGMNDASKSPNNIQISRSMWKNPHPNKTITSLSFVCKDPKAPPACFCVAITGELPAAEVDSPVSTK